MNSTNSTYYPLTFWFAQFGFPNILDILIFYTITPLSLISFGLNILAYRILVKAPFLNSEFYAYMKYYVLYGAVLSSLLTTSFICTTHNIFEFTNSNGAIIYGLYVYWFFQAILLIFGSGLEILLLIERSLYFLPASFKSVKNIIKTKKYLMFFLIASCFISTIFSFAAQPEYLDVQLDENTTHRIWYYGVANFSLTLTGNVLIYFAYIIRDILPLFLKIGLNVFIVFSIKNYMRKLEMEKLAFAQKITFSLQNNEINLNANNKAHYNFISRAERNQTYSAVIMSFFSLLEHSFYVAENVLYFFHYFEVYIFFLYAGVMSIVLKLIGNIFILYIFNSLFRNEVKRYFNFL